MLNLTRMSTGLAIALVAVLCSATSASASEYTPYRIEHGNTYTEGRAEFFNQSVRLVGEHKSTTGSGCRTTTATARDANRRAIGHATVFPVNCGMGSQKYNLPVPAEQRGGAKYVEIMFLMCTDETANNCEVALPIVTIENL
jgi:hypothetical protein